MAFTYTTSELVTWLKADPDHGFEWGWVIDRLRNGAHTFEIDSLWFGKNFKGRGKKALVNTGAPSQFTATDWAQDALREWAKAGIDAEGNYFPLIARDYAKNGPGKDDTAKSLGTTLDFLMLLSKFQSSHMTLEMLDTNAATGKDVPEVFCFIYANKYSPADISRTTEAKVNIVGKENVTGPPGLDKQFYDNVEGIHTDQSHHFAAYFCFGASHGFNKGEIEFALKGSHDIEKLSGKVVNQGDYDLGFVGAKWGDSFKRKPRFIGKEVEAALRKPDPDVYAAVP